MNKLMYLYLLVLVPTLTNWIEVGHLPKRPRMMITEIVMGIIVAFMVWGINKLYKRTIHLAETDGLTGIYNRLKFRSDISREAIRARRLGTDLMVIYMDVDRFKAINERLGQPVGDHLLHELADCLRRFVRDEVDHCYRIGGNEFALLLTANGREGVLRLERRISELRKKIGMTLTPFNASLSTGIAQLQTTDTPESLFERADRLMHQEKSIHNRAQADGLISC